MSSGNNSIQPQAAPLSHLQQVNAVVKAEGQRLDPRILIMSAVVSVVVLGAVFLGFNSLNKTAGSRAQTGASAHQDAQTATPAGIVGSSGTTAIRQADQLAPFAATQLQRNREKAQTALAEFVEQQIALEEEMDVEAWGQEELRQALAIAQQGDAHFSAERFEESLNSYAAATQAIKDIVKLGGQVFQQHVADARKAFEQRNPELADEHIQAALRIKPSAADALTLQARISKLPQIIKLIRDAKNHELGGRPEQALTLYDQILQIDPQFQGLAPLRQVAYRAQAADQVAEHLSAGFAALDGGRFEKARTAFNAALKIEPGNEIALGGLAQVAKDNDLSIINQQRAVAEEAITAEAWEDAAQAYQKVLDLDNNIQFARSGLSTVQAHAKSWELLNKISSAPQRLSNEKLYLEASDIVSRASNLQHAGPKLQAITSKVADLLELYRDPVDVVLLSDDATDIIVSNVGRLGTFTRKALKLRPGEYTIRGSQNGCRDIYLTVQVLPGLEPLDLSCPERL